MEEYYERKKKFTILLLFGILFLTCTVSFSEVIRKNGKIFIKHMKGEKWEITQAVSFGFRPYNFKHGIGRNAFSPFYDCHLSTAAIRTSQGLRILGVQGENESKAFSIIKLKGHEIANSYIGDTPITAAY